MRGDGERSTRDGILDGAVVLRQPTKEHGYRVHHDAVLLAWFAAASTAAAEARLVVDLGSGVGAVAFAAAHLGVRGRLALVERDPFAAALARENVVENGLASRAFVVEGDLAVGLATLAPALVGAADLVVANPPYHAPSRSSARGASNPARDGARRGAPEAFVAAARDALAPRGRAAFVYPAPALDDLVASAARLGLCPTRLWRVHGRDDRPARVTLVELAHASGATGEARVEAPLVEHDANGKKTDALEAILRAPRRA